MCRFIFVLSFVLPTIVSASLASAQQISAARTLNLTLPELRFDNIPVADALDFVRDVSGVNIHVNWRAMEEIGIGRDTIINVRLRSVPLRKVLQLVLSEAGRGNLLTYYIDNNVIEITTREIADRQMIMRVYPVDDLLMEITDFDQPPTFNIQAGGGGGGGGGQIFGSLGQQQNTNRTRETRAQQLIQMIQSIVKPEIWSTNGGPASIRFWNGSLIVTAPRSVHEAIGGRVE